jgi:hypothetical protein
VLPKPLAELQAFEQIVPVSNCPIALVSDPWPMSQLWCRGLDGRRSARWERIAAAGFEALVVSVDAAVQLGKASPGLRIGATHCRRDEGGSLRSDTSPPEGRSDLEWFLLVDLDLERMPLTRGGTAGVDRPGLAPLAAPVPREIFDGLADIIGDGVNPGGLSGSAHGDVAELSAAAVAVEVGGVEGSALAAMNDGRYAKLVLGVVLERDGVGADLYRRPRPAWRGRDGAR